MIKRIFSKVSGWRCQILGVKRRIHTANPVTSTFCFVSIWLDHLGWPTLLEANVAPEINGRYKAQEYPSIFVQGFELENDDNFQRHFRRCSFSMNLHLKETKSTRVFGWEISPPWCNRKRWYCIKCMNLLTVSHRCLIHLMDYLYTEPFWGEVEKRPTKSCTLQNEVSKFRTQKIHRFPMEKKEAKCLKLICWLSYLWEITMKEPFGIISLWLFSQPFSEQIPEWCP